MVERMEHANYRHLFSEEKQNNKTKQNRTKQKQKQKKGGKNLTRATLVYYT